MPFMEQRNIWEISQVFAFGATPSLVVPSSRWRALPPGNGGSSLQARDRLRQRVRAISAVLRVITAAESLWILGTSVAITLGMSLRSALTQKWEAAIVVVISTGLAIIGAHHFETSGPDQALLRQLREMQELQEERREQGAEGLVYRHVLPPRSLEPVAVR